MSQTFFNSLLIHYHSFFFFLADDMRDRIAVLKGEIHAEKVAAQEAYRKVKDESRELEYKLYVSSQAKAQSSHFFSQIIIISSPPPPPPHFTRLHPVHHRQYLD